MAIAWLAAETTTTTGTATYVLSGQPSSADYSQFSASLKNGDRVHYIATLDGSNWESGIGTWTSDNRLTRGTILRSMVAGALGASLVSWGAGTKQVKAVAPVIGDHQDGHVDNAHGDHEDLPFIPHSDSPHQDLHDDIAGSEEFLEIVNNLSDVGSAATSRTNLGLTPLATANSASFTFPLKLHPPEADSLLARLVVRTGGVGGSHVEDGALWINNTQVVYRDSNGDRQFFTGNPTGQFPVGAVPGSIWVELAVGVPPATRIQYIDTNGERRYLPSVQGAHTDANAVEGSIFVNSSDHQLHAILTRADGQEWRAHADTAHQDTSHSDTHGDVSHGDSTHGDVSHGDSHNDGSHQDSPHEDSHTDAPHSDSPHQDSHTDLHCDVFQDGGNQECFLHCDHNDGGSHGDQHVDHEDGIGGTCHIDGSHQDSHADAAHSDTNHSDIHDDTHQDSSHGDSHSDSPHTDVAHQDSSQHTDAHTDVPFQDVTHDDRPVNLGP